MTSSSRAHNSNAAPLSIVQIKERLAKADESELVEYERAYAADTRKGVQKAIAAEFAKREANRTEKKRLSLMYSFQEECAQTFLAAHGLSTITPCVVGLDEVGRGPLAGPLAVGAVVLPSDIQIEGLNDSKQIAPKKREILAHEIKKRAIAWNIQYIEPDQIDACGMTASLIVAFRRAVSDIESQGVNPNVILLDGNPLHIDGREVNVIKGDGRCAAIAAASIIAKVDRDELMCQYAQTYPEYHFESCKGYASPAHIEAIKTYGLSPIHRVSFCTAFTQDTLF